MLQGNLKAFTGVSHPTPLIDELALAICEHHTALEHLSLQQQFNAYSVITSSLLQQPHADGLRAFPVRRGQGGRRQQGVLGPCRERGCSTTIITSSYVCLIKKTYSSSAICCWCVAQSDRFVEDLPVFAVLFSPSPAMLLLLLLQAVQGLPAPFTGVQAID